MLFPRLSSRQLQLGEREHSIAFASTKSYDAHEPGQVKELSFNVGYCYFPRKSISLLKPRPRPLRYKNNVTLLSFEQLPGAVTLLFSILLCLSILYFLPKPSAIVRPQDPLLSAALLSP